MLSLLSPRWSRKRCFVRHRGQGGVNVCSAKPFPQQNQHFPKIKLESSGFVRLGEKMWTLGRLPSKASITKPGSKWKPRGMPSAQVAIVGSSDLRVLTHRTTETFLSKSRLVMFGWAVQISHDALLSRPFGED